MLEDYIDSSLILISPVQLRLQDYPSGLGKGFEAALLGKWLHFILAELDTTDIPVASRIGVAGRAEESCLPMLEILKWGKAASNRYWTTIYGGGLWLSRAAAAQAVRDSWNMADSWLVFVSSPG